MARRSRPRGHIEQLPSGSFRAKVYAGTDPLTRKRRYLVETVATASEAERVLTRLQHEVDENRHPKSAITVNQAIEKWLEVAKLEPTTRERYDDLVRLYVSPVLGRMQAAQLDAEMLERFYARLQTCRELCTGRTRAGHACRPLSASTTRKIHSIIHAALARAVRWRRLGVNPASAAEPPRASRADPDPPTPAEAARILNDAWADPAWGMLVWLLMITGARRGEVSALRWRDIDRDRSTVWVSRANAETKAGLHEKGTKTGARRRIALDPHTINLLDAHRAMWWDRLAVFGAKLDEDAFVFSTTPDASKPYPPSSISQRYRRMATKLGLRSTRLHSLRHYSATELVAAGVDIRTVAGRLGHGSGGATTLRIYAAWVEQADRAAATTLSTIVPRPIPAVGPRGPYATIADDLRDQISSGALAVGARLPTVAQLAVAYDVSVGTAHRAMATLKQDGLIQVARGKRAVVVASAPSPP
ncbi:tyrosine-type recombinase/integrase [Pseudonocardia sulfidoxydans]|uniref:tyrosine-type recombinase/integrase n=1 Tax=Pseudonocardia sulfidoxydans TaxID=54011 RepID=UPI0011BE6017|nr:tyrosine-type recombinase/integrase [Pseudonocardia sulfidoxydans]